MTFEYGWITPKVLKENAPDGANLWLDLDDNNLIHDIEYYKLDKNYSLFHYNMKFKAWFLCTNPTQDLISSLRHLEDDGSGSVEYMFGDKVVILDEKDYPQIWTVLYYRANGKFELLCDGPFISGVSMPFDITEFRKATQDEIDANKRL